MKRSSHFLIVVLLLFIGVLAMFGDVLFSTTDMVLSSDQTDLALQFLPWREFGFEQLRQGNLALWNPYTFSGMPYLGGFQSALLYPLNFLHLLLPLAKATNLTIAFHTLLLGVFMYLWLTYRGLSSAASFVASFLIMFSGAYFPHIFAGHLPNLYAMAWVPLIFLVIDGLVKDQALGWVFLGICGVSMQILAGHPQYVFYTGVSGALYLALRLFRAEHKVRPVLGFVGIYLGALLITAAQVLTGLQAASESVRSSGIPYSFAAICSFPPENVITLMSPGVFGNDIAFPYWGRCKFWETSMFIGISGAVLAVYGSIYGRRDIRCQSVVMFFSLGLLALGAYTPLFRILYKWVPGFNMFRGNTKFIFYASLFLAVLCAVGFDELTRSSVARRRIMGVTLVVGIPLIAFAVLMRFSPDVVDRFVVGIGGSGESGVPAYFVHDNHLIRQAGSFALKNILVSCALCFLILVAACILKNQRNVVIFLSAAVLVEMFIFARSLRPVFEASSIVPSEMQAFAVNHRQQDYRVLYRDNPNIAMSLGLSNICGYDPGILRRYAEFVAFSQNVDPDKASQYLQFSRPQHRFLGMLRCRNELVGSEGNGLGCPTSENDLLPRVFLVWDFLVTQGRDQIFAELQDPAFNPRKTVVLDRPVPLPVVPDGEGHSKVIGSSTDFLDIEANVSSPAILVITENYSSGWRAFSLLHDEQKYDIFPADYVFIAIPLSAGHHQIRLEYLPEAFLVGKWVSLISVFIYFCALAYYFLSRVKMASRGH